MNALRPKLTRVLQMRSCEKFVWQQLFQAEIHMAAVGGCHTEVHIYGHNLATVAHIST